MADIFETTLTLITRNAAETESLGERLGALLQTGDVLCLSGTLGAGKTCLTRGLARGWGALEKPTSPTFTLINEYRRSVDSQRFYHVDCYRLKNAADALTTGLDDIFDAEGVVVIEWPERIEEALPPERLWVQITDHGGEERQLDFIPSGERAVQLVRLLGDNSL
jgi:tRNA threonylcarbamoyladenosine biosynthesis protein TsaE